MDLSLKEKRRSSTKSNLEYKKINSENMREFLFREIPKTKIKFKNSFELEAEKEKEDEMKYTAADDNNFEDPTKNQIYINKKRRTIIQKNRLIFGNKGNEFNKDYKFKRKQ